MNTGKSYPFRFEAIGTQWEIETTCALTDHLQYQIFERIEAYDKTYSRFRQDSLIRKIALSKQGGEFEFSADCQNIFALYDKLFALTDGAVDPLTGRNLEWLGYDAEYSLAPIANYDERREKKLSWADDVVRHGNMIITKQPLVIDIGAAGKGYLVDIIGGILTAAGISDFVIDAGGDILKKGTLSLRIGLEHPFQAQTVIGVIELKNGSVCASASNRRRWGKGLHHILDGRTGQPVQNVVATWVSAADALVADGLATALFFVSASRLQSDFFFSSIRMFANGTVETSPGFVGEIFYRRSANSLSQ